MKTRSNGKRKRSGTTLAVGGVAASVLAVWATFSLTKDPAIGNIALEEVREIVALGPRPAASEAHRKLEAIISTKLLDAGLAVEQDRFTAQTAIGPVEMNNIIGRIPGNNLGSVGGNSSSTRRTIILATHYDTRLEKDFAFVGANDGGSGTGLLLALAPLIMKRNHLHNVWLLFFAGEEAFGDWNSGTPLSGSLRFAERLQSSGESSQIGAFILLDMIGDADLGILRETHSTAWLKDLVWKVADRLGHSSHFLDSGMAVEDDHLPMLKVGVPSIDLIDFDYASKTGKTYWHSPEDTVDKLSAQSLQIVGEVVLEVVAELDKTP